MLWSNFNIKLKKEHFKFDHITSRGIRMRIMTVSMKIQRPKPFIGVYWTPEPLLMLDDLSK